MDLESLTGMQTLGRKFFRCVVVVWVLLKQLAYGWIFIYLFFLGTVAYALFGSFDELSAYDA